MTVYLAGNTSILALYMVYIYNHNPGVNVDWGHFINSKWYVSQLSA